MASVGFLSFGHYVPERVVPNAEFETFLDTSDEWIKSRTGIRERRYSAPGETTSTMATAAAKVALERAGLVPDDIDGIIVATVTSDMRSPSSANLVQAALGITRPILSFDVGAACAGFVYIVSIARALILTGQYRRILVIGADNLSKFLDMTDRNTCILIGDGSGAAIMGACDDGQDIKAVDLGSNGQHSDLITFPAGGSALPPTKDGPPLSQYFMTLEGKEVFTHAVEKMSSSTREVLATAGWEVADIDWYVPHQANARIIKMVGFELGIEAAHVCLNIGSYGNTSAASIPIALSEYWQAGSIKPGQKVVISAFGGGLSWGSAAFIAR